MHISTGPAFCGLPRKFARRYHSGFSLSTGAAPPKLATFARKFHGKLRLMWQMRCIFRKISLLILHLLITSEAWQAKVQPAMFSRHSVVSLFPASANCSRAGCLWRSSSFVWRQFFGFSCWDGSSISGPSSTLHFLSRANRSTSNLTSAFA